jgi:hypothetical protein
MSLLEVEEIDAHQPGHECDHNCGDEYADRSDALLLSRLWLADPDFILAGLYIGILSVDLHWD